jgi:hypothetical protein
MQSPETGVRKGTFRRGGERDREDCGRELRHKKKRGHKKQYSEAQWYAPSISIYHNMVYVRGVPELALSSRFV